MAPAGEFLSWHRAWSISLEFLGAPHGLLSSYPSLKCCEQAQTLHIVCNWSRPSSALAGDLVDIWSGLNIFRRLSGIEHYGSARPVPCDWVALHLMEEGK